MGGKEFCLFIILASAVLPVVFALLWFVLRALGHVLTIGIIRPISLQHVKCVCTNLYTVSASSLRLQLHFPTSIDPYWAKLFVHDCYYGDSRCAVSIASVEVTLWFFPALFRFTSGPLVTLKCSEYRVQVYDSQLTPAWLRAFRDNIAYTITNEETVRLHCFKTRFVSSGLIGMTGSKQGYDGPVEKPGLAAEQDLDEVKFRGEAQQWHIHSFRNGRMYTSEALHVEFRKSWVEDRSTFVMITQNSKWVKLPLVEQYRGDMSVLRYVIRSVLQLPKELVRIIKDPLLTVDIDCQRCDLTFDKLQIRDGALIEQAGILIRRQYEKSVDGGLLSDASIDSFIQALISLYDVQASENN